MVKLIIGNKGKGKTKHLLEKVNAQINETNGNIVYLDKSTKHMYELNNKVRLIDVSEYAIENSDEFIGFIRGILSQDRDLQTMYLDNFLHISCIDAEQIKTVVDKLEKVSEKFSIDFVLSVGIDESALDESLKSMIIVSL